MQLRTEASPDGKNPVGVSLAVSRFTDKADVHSPPRGFLLFPLGHRVHAPKAAALHEAGNSEPAHSLGGRSPSLSLVPDPRHRQGHRHERHLRIAFLLRGTLLARGNPHRGPRHVGIEKARRQADFADRRLYPGRPDLQRRAGGPRPLCRFRPSRLADRPAFPHHGVSRQVRRWGIFAEHFARRSRWLRRRRRPGDADR